MATAISKMLSKAIRTRVETATAGIRGRRTNTAVALS